MKKKIIVLTDLTKAAEKAIEQAIVIAKKSGSSITLVHVLEPKSHVSEEVTQLLNTETEIIKKKSGRECELIIKEGNLFDVISYLSCEKGYDLMVVGTHGSKTLKQKLFGADILKLLAKVPFPVLVVQKETEVRENFNKIVLPVSDHNTYSSVLEAIYIFAGIFQTEVHLYSIKKEGFPWSEQLLKNIDETTRQLESRGIKMLRVKEDQQLYSLGYAKQTIKYAASVGADAIFIISAPTEENFYFANADKEATLLNDYRIPVVCC